MTNLGCGDIYDWSTGLVYKNGRYFDPTLGIWLALAPLVIGGGWFVRGKRRRKEDDKRYLLLLLLLGTLVVAGCNPPPEIKVCPTPGTPVPTPTGTPLPDPTANPTATEPSIPTAIPTSTSQPWTPTPTETQSPPTMTPYPGVPIPTVSLFPEDTTSLVENRGFSLEHLGIDLVPTSKRGAGNDAAGFKVIALHGGFAYNNLPQWSIGRHTVSVKSFDSTFEIGYSHVEPHPELRDKMGKRVEAGSEIGTLVPHEEDVTAGGMAHLHLSLKVPLGWGNDRDPSFLITNWGEPLSWSQ